MNNDGALAQKGKEVSLFESFMKTIGITKVGSFVLGFVMILLVVLSDLASEVATVRVLLISVVLLMVLLVLALLFQKVERPGFDSWGVVGLFFLGSALGILAYHARGGIAETWVQYRDLGGLKDSIYAALFLFGVIMAVFVVRVWNKEQDDFMKSVATSLGGAAIPPLLGKTIAVDGSQAFAAYFLGFAVSAAINVLYCAKLLANYSNKRSLESRARLSFLYGGDKAEAVDKQFLRNFEEDPVYARRLLINAVLEFQKRVRREFANKKDERRKKQDASNALSYYQLLSIECDKKPKDEKAEAENENAEASDKNGEAPDKNGKAKVKNAEAKAKKAEPLYTAIFREITNDFPIGEDMFRIAVSLKWNDNLEYIGAPGAYKKPLSYFSSVAGLALYVRQTIVMDRDKYKRFRRSDFPDGLCPNDTEQLRGLDEIDFLSYVAVPVASSLGQPEEAPLGVLHIDTRLFAAPSQRFEGDCIDKERRVYKAQVVRSDLTVWADKLYDQDDVGVTYMEEMRAVLVPILQLYWKCRQGST